MTTTALRGWRCVLPASVAAVALTATAAGALPSATAGPAGSVDVAALLGAPAPPGVDLGALDLARPPQASLPDPASVSALSASVARLARTMGVTPPAASPAAADLPPAVRGGLVGALEALSVCAGTTRAAVDRLGGVEGLAVALRQQQELDAAVGVDLRSCASDLRSALAGLELAVRQAQLRSAAVTAHGTSCQRPSVELWPVLAVDLDADEATCYQRDYALLVDGSGDDVYDNNAGSNLLDLQADRLTDERARGCRHAIAGLVARDCVPLAAALLDVSGDDRYGVLEPPFGDLPFSVSQVEPPPAPLPDPFAAMRPTDRPGDQHCTRDEVVARLSTQGAGLLGVGMLVDAAGDDVYEGKTGSQGTGHFYGVGALLDGAGDDRYTAVRNSQGFGLFGGTGLLGDAGGTDTYAFRMPAPRTVAYAGTSGEEPVFRPGGKLNPRRGIGGVIDDAAFCDNIPRFLQGAANVTSLGVLLDGGGVDSYTGAGARNGVQPVTAIPLDRTTGSQGFGSQGSVGAVVDLGSAGDSYSEADRGEERVRVDCTLGGAGLFADLSQDREGPTADATSACRSVPDRPVTAPPGTSAG